MTARSLRSIYQLKITLNGVRPPVWLRLQIASTDNLEDIHIALQIAMGWINSHLHEFTKSHERYGVPDEDFPSDVKDEINYRLDQILKKEKEKLNYVYDFGDGGVCQQSVPFPDEYIGMPSIQDEALKIVSRPSRSPMGSVLNCRRWLPRWMISRLLQLLQRRCSLFSSTTNLMTLPSKNVHWCS